MAEVDEHMLKSLKDGRQISDSLATEAIFEIQRLKTAIATDGAEACGRLMVFDRVEGNRLRKALRSALNMGKPEEEK